RRAPACLGRPANRRSDGDYRFSILSWRPARIAPSLGQGMSGHIAYFDCFSGASGDMLLGALIDAGLDIDVLQRQLDELGLPGYTLRAERVVRSGLAGTQVHVDLERREQPPRDLATIEQIIN